MRWTALSDARLAVLDRRFASRLVRYPEVNALVVERLSDRAHRMAVSQAISQLNGVDRRLQALFWHLAERWGRMTPHGVAVPLTLSHRVLAQLVGARRPTVSSALGELADRREVLRRDDGTWLLTGAPIGVPSPEVARIVGHRRRLLLRERAAVAPSAAGPPVSLRSRRERDDLASTLERVRHDSELARRQFVESRDEAVALCRLSDDLRRRRRAYAQVGSRRPA